MKRSRMFDPPEYLDWRPEPDAMEEFAAALGSDDSKKAYLEDLDEALALRLYEGMLRFRLHDIALKRWVRQGVISKAWLGTGEEAVTIGNVHALRDQDVVGPMIRNAGACHEKGMPLADLFRAYLGSLDQITRGRDLHTGDPARGVIPPTSFVASLVPVFAGVALAFRVRGEDRVALTWVGDGAVHTGEFHEGFSLAAARRLPLVLVIQNNQIALGTRVTEHRRTGFDDLHRAYGVKGISCHGNNVLDVYAATRLAREVCARGEGPVLLVAETFRMGGHATHDEAEGRKLLPSELYAHWGRRDPIGMYETWLLEDGSPLAGGGKERRRQLEEAEERVRAEVERASEEALASRETAAPGPEDAAGGVYADGGG
jgi:2-oxoisovalerate dehydrogenase E1 component